jgi:hypothetical protein
MTRQTRCSRCEGPLTVSLDTKELMDELYVTLSGAYGSFRDDLAHGGKADEHVLCFDCAYALCEFLGVDWHKNYTRTRACPECGVELVDEVETALCLDCETSNSHRIIDEDIDRWCENYKVR